MTTEEIARAWMASPHWGGWRVGMQSQLGWLCLGDDEPPRHKSDWERPVPDLDHIGTRAFLLKDVRKAWGFIDIEVYAYTAGDYQVRIIPGDTGAVLFEKYALTEAEALLAALQAAPEAK